MSDRDEQVIAEAIKAAIQAELSTTATAYDLDDVPGAVGGALPSAGNPRKHVEVSLSRTDAEPSRRSSGEVTVPDWAVMTRCHADSVVSVRELRRRVGAALEDRAYDLPGGGTVGPFQLVVSEPIDDDSTGWYGDDHWSFA